MKLTPVNGVPSRSRNSKTLGMLLEFIRMNVQYAQVDLDATQKAPSYATHIRGTAKQHDLSVVVYVRQGVVYLENTNLR